MGIAGLRVQSSEGHVLVLPLAPALRNGRHCEHIVIVTSRGAQDEMTQIKDGFAKTGGANSEWKGLIRDCPRGADPLGEPQEQGARPNSLH